MLKVVVFLPRDGPSVPQYLASHFPAVLCMGLKLWSVTEMIVTLTLLPHGGPDWNIADPTPHDQDQASESGSEGTQWGDCRDSRGQRHVLRTVQGPRFPQP